jgi:hypothetical protein
MDFYELITNAYVNEVIAQNDLPAYLCTLWPLVKVKYQTS